MPIPIEEIKEKGKPIEGGRAKKVDDEKLIELLKQQAYTIAELAELFGCAKGTVFGHIAKLRKQGVPIQVFKVGKEYYYTIEE